MKTDTECKFDEIIAKGFYQILKPLGFKKQRHNFYLKLEELGQIINVQKSSWYNKNHIHFTINIGIFVPQYWEALYNFSGKQIPTFPTEPECCIRQRIGNLIEKHDIWYDLTEKTNVEELVTEMSENVNKFILQYFEKTKTIQNVLTQIETKPSYLTPLSKLILYAEFNYTNKAKEEYQIMLNAKNNPYFEITLRKYGKKYGLE